MKKFNLFAIGVVAMLMAATGVVAGNVETEDASVLATCLASTSDSACKLTKSDTITSAVTVTKNITLELADDVVLTLQGNPIVVNANASLTIKGGTVVRGTSGNAAEVVKVNKEGTLNVEGATLKTDLTKVVPIEANKAVIAVFGGDTAGAKPTNVTLDASSKVDGKAGIIVYPDNYPSGNSAYNVNINLNGDIKAVGYAVQVNGKITTSENVNINVKGGSYTSAQSVALYAAGVANWTIEDGASIKGASALQVRGGKVTVNGGTFTATGAFGSVGGNAGRHTVAASLLDDANYPDNAELVIKGGKFTADSGAALYLSGATVKPSVEGGTFETTRANTSPINAGGTYSGGAFIKGGEFIAATKGKSDVSAYVVTGDNNEYGSAEDAEGNTVVGKKYTATIKSLLVSVNASTKTGFGYERPNKLTFIAGQLVDLKSDLNITGTPDDKNNKYAVKYVLTEVNTKTKAVGDKISGLTEFTMPESDIELELEIVEVDDDTELGVQVVTPAPSEDKADYSNLDAALAEAEAVVADKYTAESYAALEEAVIAAKGLSRDLTSDKQSEVDAATKALKAVLAALVEKTPDKTPSEGEPNPGTLDNVTSVAAMGGISLAIAAAGIATLKKREN